MTEETKEYKVVCYVNEKGLTALRCPQCDTSKKVDMTTLGSAFKKFKAKCKCGSLIQGQFEFRSHYRKKVKLAGRYRKRKNGKRGEILVEDLSLKGIGFSCTGKHQIQKGDHLDITFCLDNARRSEIEFWVVVENVRGQFIGAQRCDTQLYQPDLGFYLK